MRRFGVATIAVLALCVARAEAQVVHYLTAQTGGGCPATGTETTEDIHVDSVQGSCGSGVGGVDPNWFQYSASANSASGHLNVTGQLGVLDPPASFNPNNHVSVAGIQEKLTPTVPGPIHATLQIAEGVNVGGTVVRYEVSLRFNDSCSAFLAQYIGNGFKEDPDIVLSCPAFVGSATGDLNTLSVTFDDPSSTLDVMAQVRAEWFNFGLYPPKSGDYAINADLFVEPLENAAFIAASPNFLTQVPEPEESLGVGMAAAMGWIAKRRRD
jgi:hypothetical protein